MEHFYSKTVQFQVFCFQNMFRYNFTKVKLIHWAMHNVISVANVRKLLTVVINDIFHLGYA